MSLVGRISDQCRQGDHEQCPGWTRLAGREVPCICLCGHARTLTSDETLVGEDLIVGEPGPIFGEVVFSDDVFFSGPAEAEE